mgnify:CR=1 FL=1
MKKIGIIIITIIVFILGINIFNRDEVMLNIKNSTNEEINYLKLTYTGLKDDTSIPKINPNENIKVKVNIDKNFEEGSMKIYYLDEKNVKIESTIIGYFQKGDRKTVNINIARKDGNIEILSD